MSNNDPCPCLHCKAPKRYPGCHDKCTKEYIPWKARQDARKAAERRDSVMDAYIADSISRNRTKTAHYVQNQRKRTHKKT